MKPQHRGIGMTSQRTRQRLLQRLRDQGITNEAVLQAMLTTPRHLFMDEAMASRAYEDTALPIGHGQTISQPYIVARMTEIIFTGHQPDKVLEVGTGSGYQTAILACLAANVYSVERILPLLNQARDRLKELNVRNVAFKHSDGAWGWKMQGPFAGIILTAAPAKLPEALLLQLAVGGRLVAPVGCDGGQQLIMVNRTQEGYKQTALEQVSFVPLLGGKT